MTARNKITTNTWDTKMYITIKTRRVRVSHVILMKTCQTESSIN
jgi:hypothetical protein